MLRLSEAARHVIYPGSIVSTGWPQVAATAADLDIALFDPWQDGLGRIALGKDAAGRYASTVGGIQISIPRQVGKTFLIAAIVVTLCILNPGLKVVWTAHRGRTASSAFSTMQRMVLRPKVRPFKESIRTANGEQQIVFTNGSMIMFGAREAGFGRGFDAIDILVFDEAQILGAKALEDMIAAANQAQHPAGALVFYMGTPPRSSDPSEAWMNMRANALKAEPGTHDATYVEFSADDDADPDDLGQVRKANPSFPDRTPLESILRMRKQLPDDAAYLREALGVYRSKVRTGHIPMTEWEKCVDVESVAVDLFALGVEVSPELESASVSLAGSAGDGLWHVELEESRPGTDWLADYVADLLDANPQIRAVAVDSDSAFASVAVAFREKKIFTTDLRTRQVGVAASQLKAMVESGTLRHIDQPQLNAQVAVAVKRNMADTGLWTFARRATGEDITGLQAAAWALHAAQMDRPKKPRRTTERRAATRR